MADGGREKAPPPPSTRRLSTHHHERTTLPTIQALGQRLRFHEDFYHFFLKLTWPQFFGVVTLVFLIANFAFAGLYMAWPGSVKDANGFLDHFFFSVETFATIGYGEMTPANRWAHSIMSVQALCGILSTAMITGLAFARFARPTAKILFSDRMVIAPRDGVPHLMFRMANWRRNQIADAQLSVLVLMREVTKEGEVMRKPERIALVRERNPMFALSWTAMHKIDDSSPFFGNGMEKLKEQSADIFVAVTGLDETTMQTISARWRYSLNDIVPNHRFEDVLRVHDDGTRIIDYDRFHELVPIPEQQEKKGKES
jgi:inward rectifier potassium channel